MVSDILALSFFLFVLNEAICSIFMLYILIFLYRTFRRTGCIKPVTMATYYRR